MSKYTPAKMGIDPKKLREMLLAGEASGLDSVAISRHGKTLLQAHKIGRAHV